MPLPFRRRAAAFFVPLALSALSAKELHVTLPPAAVDRLGQVITFSPPPDAPQPAGLRDSSGRPVPLQTDPDGTLRFVVAEQKAGETLTFTLTAGTAAASPSHVRVAPSGADLAITVRDRPVLSFRQSRENLPRPDINPKIVRAGYVHPVFSPAGRIVTDDYPSNHPHHHGIWTPWTKTSFQGRSPDFWNMQNGTGAEDLVAVDRTWSGPVHGGLSARLQMIDRSAPAPVTALAETWELTVYDLAAAAGTPARMFDLVVTQTCATADPLILPEYHYGGFGFRGAGAWNGPGEAARFLTSEGFTDRIKGNNTRARWCYLGGPAADGALAGTATLGHPENFRAPQPVRLHPNMPYFSFVPQQLGEFRLEPGRPYVARFRFVVSDGAPDRDRIDAFWNGYAQPARATLSPR